MDFLTNTPRQRSGSGISTRWSATTPPPTPPINTDLLTLEQLRKLADEQLRQENGE